MKTPKADIRDSTGNFLSPGMAGYEEALAKRGKVTNAGKAPRAYTQFGVKWSNDGETWLAIVNDETLEEAQAHLKANTAKHKRIIKREIIETEV